MEAFEYPKGADNKINRHKERGRYDSTTVHHIINTSPVAHVSFNPTPSSPYPVVLPMIVRIAQYSTDTEPHAYIHGYVSARLWRQPEAGDNADTGLPVSICATKVDGLVLALTPFNHSYNYRSAVLYGHASLIDTSTPTGQAENLWAMQVITDGIVPNRWENCRSPPDATEISSTRILKVKIDQASAKVRDVGVKDDKKDLKDVETVEKTWTGVVPLWEKLGEPVPAETNKVKEVPEHVGRFVGEWNERVEREARGTTAVEVEKGEEGGWLKKFLG